METKPVRATAYTRLDCPHSLGKPLEWKPEESDSANAKGEQGVPTRWGNHLNGNLMPSTVSTPRTDFASPHSLGKPLEWKQGV